VKGGTGKRGGREPKSLAQSWGVGNQNKKTQNKKKKTYFRREMRRLFGGRGCLRKGGNRAWGVAEHRANKKKSQTRGVAEGGTRRDKSKKKW